MDDNQLRKHLKRKLIHKIRAWRFSSKLGSCGSNVFFDKNVDVFRFPKNVIIGDNVVVKEGAKICACNVSATIRVGENTTIGYHTFIFASEKINIGNDCLIAPFVYLVDSDHGIAKNKNINQQRNITAPIIIGNDVWIGTGVKILKGVTIGDGAVISAGAVVRNDVEPYAIAAGVPAKKISERK